MVGVGRDLCGSSSPTPLPKQGHLQQAAQDLVQVGLEYLQRRRLHSLPGQPVPVLCHPQSEEVLPHVQTGIFLHLILLLMGCLKANNPVNQFLCVLRIQRSNICCSHACTGFDFSGPMLQFLDCKNFLVRTLYRCNRHHSQTVVLA